jgi:hypothetical protein
MASVGSKSRAKLTLRQKMERAGPSLEKLKKLAKTKRPPQRWFDETGNPFQNSSKPKK